MIDDIERFDDIGAGALGFVVEDIPHHAQYVTTALLGRQISFHAISEEEQTDLVAIANGGKRQNTGKLCGKIALAQCAGSEISRSTDIHQQKNREFALFREFLYKCSARPRRDIPIDGPHLVS